MESDDNKHKLDAYEALILDAIQGDRSLFLRADEVNLAWKAVDPILEKWSEEKDFIHTYKAGTWGPEEVEQLKDNSCHAWRNNV
jgi:glucose-6-phosphate 1-dehydrogenase